MGPLAALTLVIVITFGQAKDLSRWMTNMDENLKDIPLMELAIPGSHNSGAYWMDETGPVASDASDYVKGLIVQQPYTREVLKRYSLTQSMDILSQLNAGVRHLDIRNSVFNGTFHVYHAFYGHTLQHVFNQIKTFLDSNPREVVFLGMNRCLDCTPDHEFLVGKLITEIFPGKMFPRLSDLTKVTLNDVLRAGIVNIINYYLC